MDELQRRALARLPLSEEDVRLLYADAVRKADGLIAVALGQWQRASEEWRRRKGVTG